MVDGDSDVGAPVCRRYTALLSQALFRTRTGDPLLTIEVQGREARVRQGTATTKTPQTRRIRRRDVTREWTRMRGLMFAPRSHAH